MTNSEEVFRKKVDLLERNFSVVTVIFKKYKTIFFMVFKTPALMESSAKSHRSRKPRYGEFHQFA